jgi:uncharacterized protein YjbI with pentapeptide repeats
VRKILTLVVFITAVLITACSPKYKTVNGCEIRPKAKCSNFILTEADLSDVDLSNASLYKADLSGANLSDSNLNYADLQEADLSDANLQGARLYGADLREANLTGANFRGAKYNKFTQFTLETFDLNAAGMEFIEG